MGGHFGRIFCLGSYVSRGDLYSLYLRISFFFSFSSFLLLCFIHYIPRGFVGRSLFSDASKDFMFDHTMAP